MRIGLIDNSGSLMSVAWQIQREGEEVKYWIKNAEKKDVGRIGDGLVEKVSFDEIKKWKPDAVIAYKLEKEADQLRKLDIPTVGSSVAATSLEDKRMAACELVELYGCGVLPETKRFSDVKEAKRFVEGEGRRKNWVFKGEGVVDVNTTHVTQSIEHLLSVLAFEQDNVKSFILQEFVPGVEVSLEGWFDYRIEGDGWIRPFNSTLERKRLMVGDVGPMTGCMGSIVWFWKGDRPKLFRQTLENLTPYLKKIKYVGPLDVNCIIDYKQHRPYFLEFSPRLGWNAFEAFMYGYYQIGRMFVKLARGELTKFDSYSAKFLSAIRLYVPTRSNVPITMPLERIYPKDIWQDGKEQLRAIGEETTNGLTVIGEATGGGSTPKQSVLDVYENLIPQVVATDLTYRPDIGEQAERDVELLKEWGYHV